MSRDIYYNMLSLWEVISLFTNRNSEARSVLEFIKNIKCWEILIKAYYLTTCINIHTENNNTTKIRCKNTNLSWLSLYCTPSQLNLQIERLSNLIHSKFTHNLPDLDGHQENDLKLILNSRIHMVHSIGMVARCNIP